MVAFAPVFRATVYAPRSVDSAEATVLSPVAGAPHADPFVIATSQSIVGAKPYLSVPSGRSGVIDALNKKTTVGSLTFVILDARVTPGGSNAIRWVTAFVGDGAGGNALLGRLCKVEQSRDGGVTWTPYFRGRIGSVQLNGKLGVQITLRDAADDLNVDVFVGAPHTATASYAALAQVAPLGLLQPVRTAATSTSPGTGYAGLPLTTPLRGKVLRPNGVAFAISVDPTNGDTRRTLVTQQLIATARRVNEGALASTNPAIVAAQPPKVMVSVVGSGTWQEYDLYQVLLGNDRNGYSLAKDGVVRYSTSLPELGAQMTGKTGAAAVPAANAAIDFYILDPSAQPSTTLPLLIDDVNPVTYAAHLCAGYFGRLDASGAVTRSVPFNDGGIDGSVLIPYRRMVTQGSKLNTELEALCLQYHWAYYIGANGAVTLVDLRRSATTAPVATLTDADLDTPTASLGWQQDRESAVTAFQGTLYPEQQVSPGQLPKPFDTVASLDDLPAVPTVGIVTLPGHDVLIPQIGPRSSDFRPSTLKVDAQGFRYRVDTQLKSSEVFPADSTQARGTALVNTLVGYSDEIAGPFGLGPAYVDVVCRRGSANIDNQATGAPIVTPGKIIALQFSALPDPATNQRGGVRLGLVLQRTDDQFRAKLRILDAGANAVALPPTLGTPAIVNGAITLPVTLNAAGEAVRVRYAVTPSSVAVRPALTDPLWTAGPLLTASGTATIPFPPSGQRIWMAAESMPGAGVGFKLPSTRAYPTPAYLDLTPIPAPTGLAVTGTTADALVLGWTNGDASVGVEVFLVAGSGGLSPSDATRLTPVLTAGTIRFNLPALTAGTYTVGVRHRDATGGTSTLATLVFSATAAQGALDMPSTPTGFSGSQDARYGFPAQDGVYGVAFAATVFPGFIEVVEEVETAPNSGLYSDPVAVGKVASVQGDWTIWQGVAPNDDKRRVLSGRHVRDGADSGEYTDGVVVFPWTSLPLGRFSEVVGINEVLRVSETESSDFTTRNFLVTVGAAVSTLHVHFRTVPTSTTGDVFDFSEESDLEDGDGSPKILRAPSDGSGIISFSLPHPLRGFRTVGRLVPTSGAPHFKEGASWPIAIDPAPQAINAKIHVLRNGTTASLSIDIAFGPSDGPVTVQVIQDAATASTSLLTKTMAAVGTIDSGTDAALGNIALPAGKDSIGFRVIITDTSGQPYGFGPAFANRDPLPNGTPAVKNFRANPALVCPFDPDTDAIRYTAHNGKTKTFNAAALAASGSPITYTVGDALDDASTEPALAVDELRTAAKVEYQGGGTWLEMWRGDLHGQPSNPPTADIRTEPNANRDAANVLIRPDTQVDEKLYVYYREGSTDSALEWIACVSAGDPTPLKVTAGTQLGPANFFRRVDGVGSPAAKLASIPLIRDQLAKHGVMIEGVDSGIQSPWLDVVLTLMEKPWNESFSLEWDDTAGAIVAIVAAGAHTLFETVQIADNNLFASPTTQTAVIADGTNVKLSFPLSQAQRGKLWYGRAKPNNKNDGTGLDGEYQGFSIWVPALFAVDPSTSESPTQGTLTLVVSDPGQVLDPAWTNGVITTPIHFEVLRLGVKTTEAPTTSPGGGSTTGTYTKAVTLIDHDVTINVYAHLRDGSKQFVGQWVFDSNKIADLKDSNVVDNGANAEVTLNWDTDALVGSNCARYSLDAGATWTTVTVTSGLLSQFTVARTSVTQQMLVQAKNALDGQWGNQSTVKISAYISDGPSLNVVAQPGTGSYSITWSGTGTITVSYNNGAFATPSASPIAVIRGTTDQTYCFKALAGTQTITNTVLIPALDKDTVTPNLTVTPGTPGTTTQPYTATATNPSGGAAPTLTVTCLNCSMVIGGVTQPAGTIVSISSGTVVTANRPSSTQTTQAKLKFDASIAGGGLESIVVEVTPALNLGPSLSAKYVPLTTTTGQVVWSYSGSTVTLEKDGAAGVTPGASPIAVTLDSSPHTWLFLATADGQTIAAPVAIPALASGGSSPTAIAINKPTISVNTSADTFTFSFTASPLPGGYYFIVVWRDTNTHTVDGSSLSTTTSSPVVLTTSDHGYNLVAGSTYTLTGHVEAYDGSGNLRGVSQEATVNFNAL